MSTSSNPTISIRDQWARRHAIRGIQSEWNNLVRHYAPPEKQEGLILRGDNLPEAPSPPSLNISHKKPKVINLGIVGAGAAGLFTAMVLDYLNFELRNRILGRRAAAGIPASQENGSSTNCKQSIFGDPGTLVFKYEILEANSSDRLGGRLFTYDFKGDGDAHDYFDVGAMRFPDNPVMRRTFDLFAKLGMERTDLKTNPDAEDGSLIPYYMKNGDTQSGSIEPWRYNDINRWGGSYDKVREQSGDADPFKMVQDGNIPLAIRRHSPDEVMQAAIRPLRDALKRDSERNPPGREAWDLLMEYDKLSTRQFLGMVRPEVPRGGDIPPPPYNYETIQWMEMFNGGTDVYDQAHSETVLESLDFEYDDQTRWYSILGGARRLGEKMRGRIRHKPVYNSTVTAIRAIGPMRVELDVATSARPETKTFDAVFNTTTLSCLSKMDISKAGLNYSTKQACRTLGYGPAAKIGIKFKRAWWIHDLGEHSIKKGGLGHSDLTTRNCVYPSYNIYDDESKTAVLLGSYTLWQDSQRLASLMSTSADHEQRIKEEADLKQLLFRELARLHTSNKMTTEQVYRLVSENYVDHYAFDWYKNPTTMGAFAFFRPQQFSCVWNKMIQPSGDVVVVGEAASPHHAWVVGALESVVHGIHSWLGLNRGIVPEFEDAMRILEHREHGNPFTGLPPYMDANISRWQSILGMASRDKHLGKQASSISSLFSSMSQGSGNHS